MFALIAIAWVFSKNKKAVNLKTVAAGMLLQILFALIVLKSPPGRMFFQFMNDVIIKLLSFSDEGAIFLFGNLINNQSLGFIFAFQVLPTIIFFSSLMSVLYYLGVMQWIVVLFAKIMSRLMGTSGAESLSASANIFVGQTEAPLVVRPYVAEMTQSELMAVMTGGMATIAGSVMGAYITFLGGTDPDQLVKFATYLLCASIMNAPAAIVMAKIFLPETEPEKIDRTLQVNKESIGVNVVDALATGAADGLKLAMNIGAMLLAFIAVIYALNWILVDGIGSWTGLNAWVAASTNGAFTGFSLQYIFGQVFRLFAFAMGVDWSETLYVGSFLGQKLVINEFVAYLSLAETKAAGVLSEKSLLISTYALCGFANFSSIAIQIGGIGGMAPGRQADLSRLGFRALMAASLATMMTATIAGALFS
jgi:CNT family concentrative nucleoside transporter